jgi:ABC-2 type transport system ATP-binding protein
MSIAAAPAFEPGEGVVEVRGLTKTFGRVRAVDDLSFTVTPGRVTGFLGPNGAGKTTTLRLLLGLATPDSGTATIGGRPYAERPQPARHVGAALEAASFHPGRTARNHLRVYAPQVGVDDARADEVLRQVGLGDAAGRRVGGFSMGMRQRLALAATLLGDPQVLLLDEPANGLDPEGIAWLRRFLRYLAGQGRTVLVSSHVLSEVQQTVDDVVIISSGRLVHASSLPELAALVNERGWGPQTRFDNPHTALIGDRQCPEVGAAAFARGLQIHELSSAGTSLEALFLQLTASSGGPPAPGRAPRTVPGLAPSEAPGTVPGLAPSEAPGTVPGQSPGQAAQPVSGQAQPNSAREVAP